jgi:hypothetical protein
MQKYTAHIERSGPVEEFTLRTGNVCQVPDHGTEFYLASEVDPRIAELEQCGKECSEGFRRMQERITDLERSLKSALLVIKQNENHSAVISRLAEQVIAEADKVLAL